MPSVATRTGIDPAGVDDVIWGCVMQIGEQTFNIARTSVLSAGWPESVPGTTVDRQCGSSQQAVHFAAAGIISGQYDIAVAGGVEVMSRTPMGSSFTASPLGADYIARYGEDFPNQGIGAEDIADTWGFSREQLDEFSLRSHERAQSASDEGRFTAQIAPVTNPDGVVISHDEGIRPGGTMEKLGSLKAAFREGGKITAANSSQISDGAAALLIMTSEKAAALGLTPIARFHTGVLAGVAPIPANSGQVTTRFRLNRYGDRQLNNALHTVVQSRIQYQPATRDYVARRTAEGKTGREIKRCLARYVARDLYRLLENTPDPA